MIPIRVLIADDDPGMRLVMRKLVEKAEGCDLAGEAEDGEALLRLYDEQRPDVVLMDVEMPGMTGIECARAIQDRDPRTVIVFATAHEEYMKSAFEVYAFDYLVKPFRVERALEALSRIRDRLRGGLAEAVLTEAPSAPRADTGPGRIMLKHRDGVSLSPWSCGRTAPPSCSCATARAIPWATAWPTWTSACPTIRSSAPTRATSST